ncbi:MAG: DUF2383 domain-containing protein [Luteolibacter sp.]
MSSNPNQHCIDACNSLLRGELSAVETYSQTIEKYPANPHLDELQAIRRDHISASAILAQNIRGMGGIPDSDSGAWGVFAKAVQGTANFFGPGSAVESLLQGEESGLRDYQATLDDERVMVECKAMIREELIPLIHQHIERLQQLENTLAQ